MQRPKPSTLRPEGEPKGAQSAPDFGQRTGWLCNSEIRRLTEDRVADDWGRLSGRAWRRPVGLIRYALTVDEGC
jgi:hypothetical protein